MTEAKAFDSYATNADLIALCARLGYLRADWRILDPTFGHGTFWNVWGPHRDTDIVGTDLDPRKTLDDDPVADFTALPFRDRSFDAVVFDGPYKLNGTPDEETDERYGVHLPTRWQDRMALLEAGTIECARVARRMLLVKCQDQVCSGEIRWQTRILSDVAEAQGFRLVQMLHKEGGRPQPEGRRQVHARQNYSTLLVLERLSDRRLANRG